MRRLGRRGANNREGFSGTPRASRAWRVRFAKFKSRRFLEGRRGGQMQNTNAIVECLPRPARARTRLSIPRRFEKHYKRRGWLPESKMRYSTGMSKYFLYARKPTDVEDKQGLSIEAQLVELRALAREEGLSITEEFVEKRTAKMPGRLIFNDMVKRIQKGEAQGIVCWKLDRLARNPVDGGQISWMLQQGILQHIRIHDKSYYPSDNVLMMSIEFGMANQFIRDLSTN